MMIVLTALYYKKGVNRIEIDLAEDDEREEVTEFAPLYVLTQEIATLQLYYIRGEIEGSRIVLKNGEAFIIQEKNEYILNKMQPWPTLQ